MRSHLAYASQVWCPQTITMELEGPQVLGPIPRDL